MPSARRLLWYGAEAPMPRSVLTLDGDVCGPLRFEFCAEDGTWIAAVDLGTLPADTLCVPSLILGRCVPRRYRMRATWEGGGALELVTITLDADTVPAAQWPQGDHGQIGPPQRRAQAGIDCFETLDTLTGCRLHIEIESGSTPPQADLAVSLRPRLLQAIPDDGSEAPTLAVPGFSQMSCADDIARQICSPVSVAMVLAALGIPRDLEQFAYASRHPQHRLFGIWPANLAAAWHAGASGVIRTFDSAAQAARVLTAGYPIIASIRFEAGDLIDAPLPRTGGHLVVLRGLGRDRVTVNDPAGADGSEVVREYDRSAFLRAWLGDRGVGYLLWPRQEIAP